MIERIAEKTSRIKYARNAKMHEEKPNHMWCFGLIEIHDTMHGKQRRLKNIWRKSLSKKIIEQRVHCKSNDTKNQIKCKIVRNRLEKNRNHKNNLCHILSNTPQLNYISILD